MLAQTDADALLARLEQIGQAADVPGDAVAPWIVKVLQELVVGRVELFKDESVKTVLDSAVAKPNEVHLQELVKILKARLES